MFFIEEIKNNFVSSATSTANLFLNCLFNFFIFFYPLKKSKWVTTPKHLGKPCIYNTVKNSNVYISKPIDASIVVNTKSGTFPKSVIDEISFGHSIIVILYFYETLIVIGPFGSKFKFV